MTGYDYHIHQRVYNQKQLVEYSSKKVVSGLIWRAGLNGNVFEHAKEAIAFDIATALYQGGNLFYTSSKSPMNDDKEITGTVYVYKIKP